MVECTRCTGVTTHLNSHKQNAYSHTPDSSKMDAANVRVLAETIKDFGGRVVRVVGKVENIDYSSSTATLNAAGPVQVSLNANDNLEMGKIYEVIGKVNTSDYKVNVYSVTQFSDNTNLDLHNKLAAFVPKVPELFY